MTRIQTLDDKNIDSVDDVNTRIYTLCTNFSSDAMYVKRSVFSHHRALFVGERKEPCDNVETTKESVDDVNTTIQTFSTDLSSSVFSHYRALFVGETKEPYDDVRKR